MNRDNFKTLEIPVVQYMGELQSKELPHMHLQNNLATKGSLPKELSEYLDILFSESISKKLLLGY